MIPYLFHIYGPLYANCYGIAIFLGLMAMIVLALRDSVLRRIVSDDKLISIIMTGIAVGVIGGRLLWAITHYATLTDWTEILRIWEPGFSLLGSVLGVIFVMPWYIVAQQVPVLPFLDRMAIYVPLAQSIARVGCFFVGCCHGIETTGLLGITYWHSASIAPLGIKVHPTQLYSSALLLLIFLFMYFVAQRYAQRQGQLAALYILLSCAERFFVDFWRANREFYTSNSFLELFSITQWLTIVLMIISSLYLLVSVLQQPLRSNAK